MNKYSRHGRQIILLNLKKMLMEKTRKYYSYCPSKILSPGAATFINIDVRIFILSNISSTSFNKQ